MEIIDKREQQTTTFEKLSSGDVFCYTGAHYIKIDCDCCNAVYLQSGFTLTLGDDTLVQKVNATLIIGGEEDDD